MPADKGSVPLPSASAVAVIPARNEGQTIGQTIRSLLEQNYRPPIQIVLVDDDSCDGTAEIARRAAEADGAGKRLTVVHSTPLPAGWTGKLWALSQGVDHAMKLQPDFLLFTDADIRHHADSLNRLLSVTESQKCDLVSHMVKLRCQSVSEKALIPAFVYFFLQLYPPSWIRSGKHRTAGAAGGCILIRSQVLARIGGLASIRNAVIDDCALASAVKRSGGRLWMELPGETCSLRSYGSFREIGQMISRTAFYQLEHSTPLLLATTIGLLLTYVLPLAALLSGQRAAAICGGGAWLLMTFSYWPMIRFYGLSPAWCLGLPAVALFYLGATVHSAVQYWTGRGGTWKGRVQDAHK